jgi:hypothetical protein
VRADVKVRDEGYRFHVCAYSTRKKPSCQCAKSCFFVTQ